MIWSIGIFLTTVFLAYANGANDNFKGVATLFGSETINYKLATLPVYLCAAATHVGYNQRDRSSVAHF